jgi:hypothetical protein
MATSGCVRWKILHVRLRLRKTDKSEVLEKAALLFEAHLPMWE